jgi:hypothetical protein
MNQEVFLNNDDVLTLVKAMGNFRLAAETALDSMQGIVDDSWNELKENFDPCKSLKYVKLVAVLENFSGKFTDFDDVMEWFRFDGDE